jgi:hypothetical protein
MSAPCTEPISENCVHLDYKGVLDHQLWERLVRRVIKDEDLQRPLAERIMNQALAFLLLCASEPDGKFAPSPLVDIGWHTFILYTKPYADFCDKVSGRFIHHAPSDVDGVDYGSANIARTVTALQTHGFIVDQPLWTDHRQDCGESGDCTSGDGCTVDDGS